MKVATVHKAVAMRPFAHAEGMIFHGWSMRLFQAAAQRDDVFVGFEDPVRQPVVALNWQTFSAGSTRAIVAAAPGR